MSTGTYSISLVLGLTLCLQACTAGQVGQAPAVDVVTGPPEDAVTAGQTVIVMEGDPDIPISFVTELHPSLFEEYALAEMCVSPCTVRIPDGDYAMVAGEALDDQFELEASGGVQRWEVSDANWWLFGGGLVLLTGGVTGVLIGGLSHSGDLFLMESGVIESPGDTGYEVLALVGLGATIAGIVMLANWPPDAARRD